MASILESISESILDADVSLYTRLVYDSDPVQPMKMVYCYPLLRVWVREFTV